MINPNKRGTGRDIDAHGEQEIAGDRVISFMENNQKETDMREDMGKEQQSNSQMKKLFENSKMSVKATTQHPAGKTKRNKIQTR